MTDYIVDVNEANAQQVLIDESRQRLVVIDFWADWCTSCKALMPVLEKLAHEYEGQFVLAKINADEQQGIAGQFGIRSLPTVMIMKDGQPVDGFAGAQPESAVRELLERHLPKPYELALDKALEKIANEDWVGALPLLKDAVQGSGERADIVLQLARVYLELKRHDETQALLEKIKMADQDSLYEQLVARLELIRESAKSPEIQALEARLNTDPDDKEAAYQLAVQFSQNDHYREALELLLNLLRKDMNFADGQAKKIYTDILATLGAGDSLAIEFQRRFYTLLY